MFQIILFVTFSEILFPGLFEHKLFHYIFEAKMNYKTIIVLKLFLKINSTDNYYIINENLEENQFQT